MDSNTKHCPSCGMQAAPEDAFCTLCGAKIEDTAKTTANSAQSTTHASVQPQAPNQPSQPQSYNSTQQGYIPYNTQPQQPPTGYSAPPPQPGYQNVPQPGYPTAPVTTMQAQPPKPKRSPAIVVIMLLVGLLALAVVFFVARMGTGTGPKQEYANILEEITGYSSPYDVASYYKTLNAFQAENPKVVDDELVSFVALCRDFENEAESDAHYTAMIAALDDYKASSINRIASCARRVSSYVQDEYEYFQLFDADGGLASSFDITTFDAALQWTGEFVVDPGKGFSFGITNTSDKEVTGFEIWAFFYDENGLPVYDSYDANWEWVEYTSIDLAAGESMTADDLGLYYWESFGTDVVNVFIFINYVEYADGSYEGMTDFLDYTETELWYSLMLVNEIVDEWALNNDW